MHKLCKCGQQMDIHLRTIIYQNKVEIDNVPIYTCKACHKSEVFYAVKHELTPFISQMGNQPLKQQINFAEHSELARLMTMVSDKAYNHYSVENILQERINELLDLLLLARSLMDEPWIEDIRKRLQQITSHTLPSYDVS